MPCVTIITLGKGRRKYEMNQYFLITETEV